MNSLQNIARQSGISILSLMIGIFISMVCILTSLTLYKNLVDVSAGAKIDTLHDGQLAGAFLTLQLEIQSAGYQITNNAVDNVVRRESGDTLELLWRYNDGDFQCRGFKESSIVDDGMTYRVLSLVKSLGDCDGVSELTAMSWGEVVATLGRWPVREDLANYMVGRDAMLDINLETVACSPYGAVISGDHLLVTVSGPSSSRVHVGAAGAMTSFQYCLLNT